MRVWELKHVENTFWPLSQCHPSVIILKALGHTDKLIADKSHTLCTSYLPNVRLFENKLKECALVKHTEVRKLVVRNNPRLNLHQFVQRHSSMQYHTVQVLVNGCHHDGCVQQCIQ